MAQVIKIKTIRSKSSLKYHQFKSFFDKIKYRYCDLLFYNNLKSLNKGFVFQRIFVILKEIKLFFFSSDQLCAKDYFDFLEKKILDLLRF